MSKSEASPRTWQDNFTPQEEYEHLLYCYLNWHSFIKYYIGCYRYTGDENYLEGLRFWLKRKNERAVFLCELKKGLKITKQLSLF